jgi:hypothetical protein
LELIGRCGGVDEALNEKLPNELIARLNYVLRATKRGILTVFFNFQLKAPVFIHFKV